jgi:hypothetical protein
MKPPVCFLTVLALAVSSGCATTQLSDHDRSQLSERYTSTSFELAHSMWVSAFFQDESHRLLSSAPPDEVELLDRPNGTPMIPGLVRSVLPAGTSVKVVHISFSTTWENLNRPVLTPRDRTWVELAVAGQATPPTFVLLIRPNVKNEGEVMEEIGKLLTDKPIDVEVKKLSDADRKAIATRELAAGLTSRALELMFGTPVLKRINGDGTTTLEDWTWRSDVAARTAHIKDGVVVSFEGPPVKREEPSQAH